MNICAFLSLAAVLALTLPAWAQTASAPAPAPFRLLYNSDGNHIFHGERRPDDKTKPWHERNKAPREPISVEELLQFVDEVADSQVDTFLLCPVNNQVVSFRSTVEKRLGDGATDEELAASANPIQNTVRALRHFDALGVDPFALLVKRIREKKMRPLVAYRVQQAHAIPGKLKTVALSPFWEAHPDYRLKSTSGGEPDSALDMAIPEVRAHKIALLRELVTKYPFDGCELDFQRFPLFFSAGKEIAGIPRMNEFVRDVRRMLDQESASQKRRLYLGVRVPETPARCRELGLDPAAWVNEGILDFVVVTKFLAQNPTKRYAIPHLEEDFAAFRKSFEKPVALLGAIQEAYTFQSPPPRTRTVQYQLGPDDYRREAAKLWGQKVDGIELFNFFMSRSLYDARGDRTEPPFFLLKELGDPQTLGQIHTPEEAAWQKAYPRKPLPPELRQELEPAKTAQ